MIHQVWVADCSKCDHGTMVRGMSRRKALREIRRRGWLVGTALPDLCPECNDRCRAELGLNRIPTEKKEKNNAL